MKIFINRLIENKTSWPFWYAIIATFSAVFASIIIMIGSSFFVGEVDVEYLKDVQTSTGIVSEFQNEVSQNYLEKSKVALSSLSVAISSFLTMLLIGLIPLLIVSLFHRKIPTRQDLGFDKKIDFRAFLIILAVFVFINFLIFVLSKLSGASSNAVSLFQESGFGAALPAAILSALSVAILAPIGEEILYRGVILRSFHDGISRYFKTAAFFGIPVISSIIFSGLAFTLPHIGNEQIFLMATLYMITSIGFGFVYVTTGSMSAAMVSHAFQSAFTWGQVIIFGASGAILHPIIYIIVFGAPVIVYITSLGLGKIFKNQIKKESSL